jgi:hypothetical protein
MFAHPETRRSPILALILSLGLAVFPGISKRSLAADWKKTATSDAPSAFDIPSQPLSSALDAFSAGTGIEILVDARNVQERQSVRVKGVMPARRALGIILAGTHLVAEEFTPGTITLMIAPVEGNAAATLDPPYFAAIQHAVLNAFCRHEATAPGSYRLALRLEIRADGWVSRSKLLSSTGRLDRDQALKLALTDLNIGAPPPRDLPQPVAIVVQPRTSESPGACPLLDPGVGQAHR